MLEGNHVLDLVIFRSYPSIVLVAVCVKSSQCGQTQFILAMIDEPSGDMSISSGQSKYAVAFCLPWRLREQHDQHREEPSWNDLNTKRYPPLIAGGSRNVCVRGIRNPTRD